MKKHLIFTIAILMVSIVLFSACSATGQYFLFGTFVELNIQGSGSNKIEKEIVRELDRLEKLFSVNIVGSDVWKINNADANVEVKVSSDTMEVLLICKDVFEKSDGAFDPTVFPLVRLWKLSPDTYTGLSSEPPASHAISELLAFVGFNDMLRLDAESNTVLKTFKQVQIDFGGVAKGYAVRKAVEIAEGKTALLNLGGNIACVGKTYKIGIANPRKSETAYFGSMSVDSGFSVSTSGDYERYYEYNATRYHHIINPKTGYPCGINPVTGEMNVDRLVSVTIISDKYSECDAYATAVLILGKTDGKELLETLGIKAVLIDIELNCELVGDINFDKK